MFKLQTLLGAAVPTEVVGSTVCPPGGALSGYESGLSPALFIKPFQVHRRSFLLSFKGFKKSAINKLCYYYRMDHL